MRRAVIAQRALLLSIVCFAGTGCSFLFVRPAPANHEQLPVVSCTSSRLAPIADVAAAVHGGVTVLAVGMLSSMTSADSDSGLVLMEAMAIGYTATEVASAAYGFHHTAECDRAEQLWQMSMMEAPSAAPPTGCMSHADCKHGRSCVRGLCTSPN